MNFFSRFIVRWAGLITLAGVLLTGAGGYYSARLYMNLRTSFEEMLPTTARSVIDLNKVTDRLPAADNITILLFSDHPKASKRFVDDLAAKLKKAPPDTVAYIEYKIEEELKFFNERRPLYMEMSDLSRIKEFIRDKIDYERELRNPLTIFSEVEIPEPKLDFKELERKYEGRASIFSRFPGGYYATPDEKIRAMLVYMPGKISGVDTAHRMRKTIDQAIAELNPASYADDIVIKFAGGVQNLIEEESALIADLELATIIVMVLTVLAMWVYFRSARATFAVIAALMMGTLWAFGLSYFIVGYLNANSAFLGAIVIGNGINYGIIFIARYLEERQARRGHMRAVHEAITETSKGTLTASLAAALAYGSLMLTSFRGFSQFGVIGLIGMVFCWISAFTLLPAILTLMDRSRSLYAKGRKPAPHPLATALARLVGKHPGKLWAISCGFTLISLATFTTLGNGILLNDLSKLRDKTSMTTGSGFNATFVEDIFGRELSPVVVLTDKRSEAEEIAATLKRKMEREGESSLITGVRALSDFLPEEQWKKIKLLQDIRRSLFPDIYYRLSSEDQKQIDDLLSQQAFKSVRPEQLPPLIMTKFTEKTGDLGRMVLVEPQLNSESWDGNTLNSFIDGVREVADAISPNAVVAGQLPVTSDMLKAIKVDGPKATLFAFLAVLVLVIFLFRNLRVSGLVILALMLGVVWLAGLILGFSLKINFLNFIALPITFGIGVDYSVNVIQRYQEEGSGRILEVIRGTGGAVGLASLTTIVGYGSLLIAGNQAFVSFGLLAVLGEVTCLFAALVSVPAYLCYRESRLRRRLDTSQTA